MNSFLRAGCLLLFCAVVVIVGCNSNVKEGRFADRLKVAEGVNIWNSIHYEVFTDFEKIKSIEPSAKKGSLMFQFLILLENRGDERADLFHVTLDEAKPFKYTDGSTHNVDHGYLDRGESYELYGYYTFRTGSDMEQFIAQSDISVTWNEAGENKELNLRFPSRPTQ